MNAREESLARLESSFQTILNKLRARSKGYADDADPFKNIRFAALAANISEERHFLALIGHKLARIENLIDRPLEADKTGERLFDSIDDLIGYAALLKDWLGEKIAYDQQPEAWGAGATPQVVPAGQVPPGTEVPLEFVEAGSTPFTLGDQIKKLLNLNGPVSR